MADNTGLTKTGLTGTGHTIGALAVVLLVAGLALRYPSLVAIGLAFALIIVAAVAWVVRRPRVESSREVRPVRIAAGGTAISELVVENRSRRRTAGGVALEGFGDVLLPIVLPALEPGESQTVLQPLPTDRRGVYQVGPLLVSRSDPFGLLRVGQHQRDVATLWVHPRVIDLAPLPSGLHRDLDGPDSGDAPEGGITFHNLREYVEGDDLRLVHWRSFAKTDVLMVRHNIDSHQPRSLVLLDTRAAVHDDESIEEAISIAGSIVMASMVRRFPFMLYTTCGTVVNQSAPRAQVLDALAALEPVSYGSIDHTVQLLNRDPGGSSLTLISGRCSTEDLACVAPLRTRFDAITIGRFGPHEAGEMTLSPGSVLVNASSVAEFAKAWNRRRDEVRTMTLLDEPTLASVEMPAAARPRRTRPMVPLEVLLFMGLVLLASTAYEPVFRSFRSFVGPVFGAAALSCLLAVALKRVRMPARFGVMISLVAGIVYLAYTVLVDSLSYGVVPGPHTLDAVRDGVGNGWQHMLDGTLPVTDSKPALVWLGTVVWIVAHLTTDVVQRSRLVALPLVPPIVLFGLSLPLVSATDEPSMWLVGAFIGIALGAVLVRAVPDARTVRGLGTTSDGITEFHSRSVMSARLRMGLPIAAVAMLVALPLAGAITGDDPFDPRDLRDEVTVPEVVSDPLGQLKAQISTAPPAAAFRVSFGDESDALAVQRVSVLHLDTYDGVRWTSDGSFRGAGGRLTPAVVPDGGRDVVQTYTIAAFDDPWLPVAGTPLTVDLSNVAYDAESGDLLAPGSVSGLTYRVVSRITEPSADDLANAVPADDPDLLRYEKLGGEIPPALSELAAQATAGATSPTDALVRLEQFLRTEYSYDAEATAGHSYGRLSRFLTDGQRGTAEQFAASYAVLARSLGFPARVVVGYKVVDNTDGVLTPIDFVASNDYHAWVEVMFDDLGWVAFDPTPPPGDTPLPREDDTTAPATTITPLPESGGQVTPEEAGPTEGLPEPDNDSAGLSNPALVYGGGALAGIVVLLIMAALTIVLLKRHRRKRRKTAPAPADRIVGAWNEVLDRLSEMHFPVDPAMTPRDVARAGVATYGAPTAAPLGSLAPAVSRAVFAREEPAEFAALSAWKYTTIFERNLASTLTRRQRLAARLSPRPLRRRKTEDVFPATR